MGQPQCIGNELLFAYRHVMGTGQCSSSVCKGHAFSPAESGRVVGTKIAKIVDRKRKNSQDTHAWCTRATITDKQTNIGNKRLLTSGDKGAPVISRRDLKFSKELGNGWFGQVSSH